MLTGESQQERMTRALLTDGERDAVRDDPEMDSGTKSSHLSRIRAKKDGLREDGRLLREHRPDLYQEMRDAFVEEEIDERIARLENEVEELREQLDD